MGTPTGLTPAEEASLSPEAVVVLGAIGTVNERLDTTADLMRKRIRVGVAIIVVVLVAFSSSILGYLRQDRVDRCQRRNELYTTVQDVLTRDHNALPAALLDGFGDTADVRRIVAVINAGYDKSEAETARSLPLSDCSGLWP